MFDKEPRRIKKSNLESFGVVMLKPHSLLDGTAALVRSLLYGYNPVLKSKLLIPPPYYNYIEKMVVVKSILVNLGDSTRNSEAILDAFYLSDSHLPHYPILRQVYSAPAEFHLIRYPGNQEELDISLKKLKGNPRVIDEYGNEKRPPLGVRGALLPTAVVTGAEESGQLVASSEEYLAATKRMLNNIIHTTDGIHESIPALKAMFAQQELVEMEQEGISLIRFMSQQMH